VVGEALEVEVMARDLETLIAELAALVQARPIVGGVPWGYMAPFLSLIPVATHVVRAELTFDVVRKCIYPTALSMMVVRKRYHGEGEDWSPLTRSLYRTQTGLPAAHLNGWLLSDPNWRHDIKTWRKSAVPEDFLRAVPGGIGDLVPFRLFMEEIMSREFYDELYSANRSKDFKTTTPPETTFLRDLEMNLSMLKALRFVGGLPEAVERWGVYTRMSGYGTLQLVVGHHPHFMVRSADGIFHWENFAGSGLAARPDLTMADLVPVARDNLFQVMRLLMEQDMQFQNHAGPDNAMTFNYVCNAADGVPLVKKRRSPLECQALLTASEVVQIMCYGKRPRTPKLRACRLPLAANDRGVSCIRVDGTLSQAIMLALMVDNYSPVVSARF